MKNVMSLKSLPNNFNRLKIDKIKIKFDILTLDSVIGFIYKDSVLRTRKALTTTYKLFISLDDKLYEKDAELYKRVWVIRKSLEARLIEGFENDTMIRQYCINHVEADEMTNYIIDNIDRYKKQLTHEESRYLIKAIDDRLRFGYTVTLKESIQDILDKIDDGDFKSYKAVSEDLYDIASTVINLKRNTNSLDSDETFSLSDEEFENTITESVTRLKDKNKVFVTGIRGLNTILAPGYLSKRLYTFLAFPGGGKSQILLKTALDVKKYNPHIKAKDPDKIPAVLYITMENSIDETIERMYNLLIDNDDIRNYTPKQIIRKFKEDGGLTLTDRNNMDIIIKYYDNRSIDTGDLYSIIKDLNDSGKEVVALFLDYLKRIRPAEKADTEKAELKNITNELKTVAKHFDIPVDLAG